MASITYTLTVFVNEESPITPELLVEAIKEWYVDEPAVQVKITPEEHKAKWGLEPDITVQYPMEAGEDSTQISEETKFWEIHIRFLSEPSDSDYIESILEDEVDHPDYAQMAASTRWITVAADNDDNMVYFNDKMYVEDAIASFPGVYIYVDKM